MTHELPSSQDSSIPGSKQDQQTPIAPMSLEQALRMPEESAIANVRKQAPRAFTDPDHSRELVERSSEVTKAHKVKENMTNDLPRPSTEIWVNAHVWD